MGGPIDLGRRLRCLSGQSLRSALAGGVRKQPRECGQEARPLVAQGAEQRLVLLFPRGSGCQAGYVVGEADLLLARPSGRSSLQMRWLSRRRSRSRRGSGSEKVFWPRSACRLIGACADLLPGTPRGCAERHPKAP